MSYSYLPSHRTRVAPRRLTTSFAHFPKLQDTRPASLQTQHEFLNLLRLRHLQWMSSAEDPATESLHMEIAHLIDQITDRYNQLLGALEQPTPSQPPPMLGEGL